MLLFFYALKLVVKSERDLFTGLHCLLEIHQVEILISDFPTLCSVVGVLPSRMDLSLDALCEDLQSCFDPDPAATARATNLVAAQVGGHWVMHAASLPFPLMPLSRWRRLL